MAKFKEKELQKISEYDFSIQGNLNKIKKITNILEHLPLDKIILSSIGYVIHGETPVNLNVNVLRVDYDGCNVILMRPKYHVLDNVIINEDPNTKIKGIEELGEIGKRIKFSEYWIEIFYNRSLKDEL